MNITDNRNRIPRGVPQELFQEIIQDLIIRFILCCPEEEHESFERLFFQIEEAHWFYLDFYREKHPKLPALSFKQFAEIIFNDCPLLQSYKHSVHQIRSTWVQYKTSVPVCGAIILNQALDSALLVKAIGGAWSFPRGKINKDEPSTCCAIREVFEETSLDISKLVHENEFIELVVNEQTVKLFIVVLDCHESELPPLYPQTRGEISEIQWLHLDDDILIHNGNKKMKKFWGVHAFARQVKQWIQRRRPNHSHVLISPLKAQKTKPSKRSGKNGARRVTDAELDYQIPTPRANKQKKTQPITILKRGETLSSVNIVPSSYTPPSEVMEASQMYAYAPTTTGSVSSYSQKAEFMSPVKSSVYAQSYPNSMHMKQDSFLNFTFNAEDIVGDLTVVM